MKNVFEIASREKYRFPFKGQISTEELWDLSLEQLNSVYKALVKSRRVQTEDSLLMTIGQTKDDVDLENRIEIVKYVFEEKQKEIIERRNEADRQAKREKYMALLEKKEEEELSKKSVEELRQLIDET